MSNPGHVFVVRGRLENLDHDATLVPTDLDFVVTPGWAAPLGLPEPQTRTADWDERIRRLRPDDWADRRWGRCSVPTRADGRPVWFVDSAAYGCPEDSLGPMVHRVRAALHDMAAAALTPHSGRPRPLLALPTLGVRQGGFNTLRGDVIDHLLGVCQEVASTADVDVVVVAATRSDHAAFQARRRRLRTHEAHLEPALLDRARDLADRAREGSLALFIGAGVGMSAGLPSWTQLLRRLAERADVSFGRLESALDRSELLRRRLGDRLGPMVAEEVRGTGRYGLTHALLAAFGCEEAVTTNYDDLYERAVRDADGGDLPVLPFSPVVPRHPWLLKMHGDADHPDTIVLSRSDFVGYDARSRPMGAVVQSLMLTKHLLVVGASMTDDNFLRLAHEVLTFQESGRPGGSPPDPLGTVLSLRSDPAAEELWEGRFDHLSAAPPDSHATSGALARRLAIFLDAVAMYASPPAHLADERYTALLDEDERPVAAAARALQDRIADLPDGGTAWAGLASALRDVGARPS